MMFISNLENATSLNLFGGKAINLTRLINKNFNVPDGFVISTSAYIKFVELNNIQKIIKDSLEKIDYSSQKSLDENSEIIRKAFISVKIPDEISKEISENLKKFKGNFAVRSSATAEDLPTMSFAGLQDTYLNVKAENIDEAVIKCFSSLWTSRAISYRKENKIDQLAVLLSVIVQEMVQSDSSGVVFTINPANNCYDELVINSNFGLGESVVSGQIIPDSVIFDKYTKQIIEKKPGSKENIIISKKDGETEELSSDKTDKFSLTETQINNLSEICINIEKEYKIPMDIEWAIKDDTIYILQARPITTWIPLPEEMLTEPGEEKYLYADFMVTRQGINKNFSMLGIDFFSYIQRPFAESLMGQNIDGIKDGLTFYSHGRGYINLSNMFSVFGERFLRQWERVADIATLSIIKNNVRNYKQNPRPKRLKLTGFRTLTKFIFGGKLSSYFRAWKHPKEYMEETIEKEKWLTSELTKATEKFESYQKLSDKIGEIYTEYIAVSLMVTYSSEKARVQLDKIFDKNPELKGKVNMLERSLSGNITIEMGLEMFKLSQLPEVKNSKNYLEFKNNLSDKASKEFKKDWENYLNKFGMRCPMELDIASERPSDNPELLYSQLKQMSNISDPSQNPISIVESSAKKREQTFEELLGTAKDIGKEKDFKKAYEVMMIQGGYRETHKYFIILAIVMMKKEVLKLADKFVKSGRLKKAEQIFDLTVKDLDDAINDKNLDLIKLGMKNTEHIRKTSHVKYFPRVIDSRGKIALPLAPKNIDGQLVGEAISAGIYKGKVKVLFSPDEKPLHPGEILVARTSDPGWTPLFINAGAVILEIGGMLQHGALVAREYGKPCVAGIISATEILKDGQEVEVDGSNGVVRIQ